MHVELTGTQPPVWRRVDLASDLFLDRIHDVLQMVMGWQDYHLHQFASGGQAHDPKAENYVMPAGLAEGIVGIDERRVRLDEVLVGPGDRLFYEYDFGDSWSHTLDLEEVIDRSPGADPARCVGGEWACPPEDCGGIGGTPTCCRSWPTRVIPTTGSYDGGPGRTSTRPTSNQSR